jgi:MerR family transcriptional regulator, light-induced transcriptional regulator
MSDESPNAGYSIKAVSQATGLTVETLRAWERRYRVIEPKRDESGHRIYAACDISRLRRLRETTERGHQIGKIAHLSNEELSVLLSDPLIGRPAAAAAQVLVTRILCSVEKYRPTECEQIIALAFALLPAADVVRDVLAPALHEVGDRWHRGEFTIGQERIASSAARRQLTSLLTTFGGGARGPSVVFATVSGEQHELGILMHAALAASLMLRAYYLGPDMPAEEIGNYARRVNACAVAISMVMPDAIDTSLLQLKVLRKSLPANAEIWIGGAGASSIDPAHFPAGSIHMVGRGDFEQRVGLLGAGRREPGS